MFLVYSNRNPFQIENLNPKTHWPRSGPMALKGHHPIYKKLLLNAYELLSLSKSGGDRPHTCAFEVCWFKNTTTKKLIQITAVHLQFAHRSVYRGKQRLSTTSKASTVGGFSSNAICALTSSVGVGHCHRGHRRRQSAKTNCERIHLFD